MIKKVAVTFMVLLTGCIISAVYFAFKYPSQWNDLPKFNSQKELFESFGPVDALGTMRSSRFGKVLEEYTTWTVEHPWTGYSLTCTQYDDDQEIHYKIDYYNWLIPFFDGFTVRSGVTPLKIHSTEEEKEYIEELRKEEENQASHTMSANARLFHFDPMEINLNRLGISTEAAIVWI